MCLSPCKLRPPFANNTAAAHCFSSPLTSARLTQSGTCLPHSALTSTHLLVQQIRFNIPFFPHHLSQTITEEQRLFNPNSFPQIDSDSIDSVSSSSVLRVSREYSSKLFFRLFCPTRSRPVNGVSFSSCSQLNSSLGTFLAIDSENTGRKSRLGWKVSRYVLQPAFTCPPVETITSPKCSCRRLSEPGSPPEKLS